MQEKKNCRGEKQMRVIKRGQKLGDLFTFPFIMKNSLGGHSMCDYIQRFSLFTVDPLIKVK